ncbi:hypothetical protein Ddye_013657 [Dipteronia dyeriana]|uniref:RNase H type-1 domain-containing protein n=1 Tax=Dipteronia dyeriana TaxID=168575 RepID=A0AAE0CJV2_9ROSI|nr:hypothetical protein Ddye_013657 [Dipteronia dyeriana]
MGQQFMEEMYRAVGSSMLYEFKYFVLVERVERCVDSKAKFNVKWIQSAGKDLLFNVDGSSRGSPSDAGIGGVLRDSNGKVLCLFSLFVGVEDSNSAEVMVIHKACFFIAYDQRLSGGKISTISDSKTAISWINGKDFGNIKQVNLILDIRNILQSLIGLSICFMPWGMNSFTDSLAKGGSGRCGYKVV